MADAKVVEYLHQALAAEIHAIAQYMDHHARSPTRATRASPTSSRRKPRRRWSTPRS